MDVPMKCKICGSESGSYPLCRTCYAKWKSGEKSSAFSPMHPESDIPFLYEAKPSLVTKNEMAYLGCIQSFLPDTCRIQAQANLTSFIRRTDGAKYQNELFRNVDFIITDLSYRPLLVIEVNDQTHRMPKRRERGKKVACICEEAGPHFPAVSARLQKGRLLYRSLHLWLLRQSPGTAPPPFQRRTSEKNSGRAYLYQRILCRQSNPGTLLWKKSRLSYFLEARS